MIEVIDLTEDEDQVMNDTYLDCNGKERTFRIGPSVDENFLCAMETRDDEPTGVRIILPVEPGKVPPWFEMREKIRSRLSQRSLVRDKKGRLQDVHRIIRAQITDTAGERTPSLLIDDMEVNWEEFGELLVTYAGWGLRIEICTCGEE